MLIDEYATSVHIKSRENRHSVQSAIGTIQQKLKQYLHVPENGLAIFCGDIESTEGKAKTTIVAIEPEFGCISKSLYLCDNKFHTDVIEEMFNNDPLYGYIVVDGNGCLFGTLQGSRRLVLQKFTVDLPKKHGKGGQSALRFARLRLEKRHNYIRKVSEMATFYFIDQTTNKCNVTGLVLAGSADFKNEVYKSNLFDPRLHSAVIEILDVSYGMTAGLNQAIESSGSLLQNVKLLQEKKLLQVYFETLRLDNGLCCYTVEETIGALEAGAVETLIVWESLSLYRVSLRNLKTKEMVINYVDETNLQCTNHNELFETMDQSLLIDWMIDNVKSFGVHLEIISDNSPEGTQFCRGFGGIGALLRWKYLMHSPQNDEELGDIDVNSFSEDDETDFI